METPIITKQDLKEFADKIQQQILESELKLTLRMGFIAAIMIILLLIALKH